MSSINGHKKLVQRLARVRSVLPTAVAGSGVQELLLKRVLSRYDREVTPDGLPWPPLAASTIRTKKTKGYPTDKMLVASGTLRKSIGVIGGSTLGLTVVNTGLGFRIGVRPETNPEGRLAPVYGKLINKGLGTVRRRFLGVNSADVKSVQEYARRQIKKAANG